MLYLFSNPNIALANFNLILSFQGLAHLISSGAKVEIAFQDLMYVMAMLTVPITVMNLAVVCSISIRVQNWNPFVYTYLDTDES